MRGIGKSFGGVAVLSDVDLVVQPGEVMALLGSNGAGKSTLVKILTGVYARDAGTVRVDGRGRRVPRSAGGGGGRRAPSPAGDLGDGRHDRRREHLARRSSGEARARLPGRRRPDHDASARGRCSTSSASPRSTPATLVKRLSVAEQRIVEIARALAGKARVLVMDEPTAALTEQEAKLIFRIIARLKEQQVAVIYISHYLNEVFEISDRVAVLRDGRNAGLFDTRSASRGEVLAAMLGRVADDLYDIERKGDRRRRGPDRHRPVRAGQARRRRSQRSRRRDRRRLRADRLRHRDAGPRRLWRARPADQRHRHGRRQRLSAGIGARRQGPGHRLRRRRPQARGHHRRPHRPREHGRAVPGSLRPRPVRVARGGDRAGAGAGSTFSASAPAARSR